MSDDKNKLNYYDPVSNAHDPFSDWSKLIHRPVYSIDGKKIGFVRKLVADYMLVKKGLVNLNKYFIPKSLAESLDKKKRIRLKVDANEVRTKYSYAKMKDLLTALENVPEQDVKPNPLYDRLQTFRHGVTRNRSAGCYCICIRDLILILRLQGKPRNLQSDNKPDYCCRWS